MEKPALLLIGEDADSREEMASFFRACGMLVSEAGAAADATQCPAGGPFELVIADLTPRARFDPALWGLLRDRSVRSILIMDEDELALRIFALECGADECAVRPVKLRALLTVATRLLGRSEHIAPPAARWRFDGFHRSLFAPDGAGVPLTTAEFELLTALVENEGEPQSRDTLCKRVFNREWQPFDRGLDAVVVKLRRKLRDDSDNPTVIKTVRSRGYVFTGFAD